MRTQLRNFSRFCCSKSLSYLPSKLSPASLAALLLLGFATAAGSAQSALSLNRITKVVDPGQIQALPNHHPLWANAANDSGALPVDQTLNQFTMVLARSPQQEQALEQLMADQQSPASPNYHHWLTPTEVGDRFGLSDSDLTTITSWLQSQGLHVNWVSPSRIFIGFGGAAADVGRAFQAELHSYNVNGNRYISVASDPMIPEALAPAIRSVRGLYTINEQPNHRTDVVDSASPLLNAGSGAHFIAPADFNRIYDVPSSLSGAGVTIGIVDRSRTNFADFDNFRSKTGTSFPNPTEVVPTAFGGADPGPAYTAPPGGSISTGEQGEATLDVLRAGSVAPGANLLLVVATSKSGGIDADAEYLVNTTPLPAQIMSISFGACESAAGSSGVTFWNSLFQTAASEGISVFVSSGDSGASGCDIAFSAPPASPAANSPNYICSSSYVTCLGGTQFNDTTNPSSYWSSTNGSGYLSALSYIPEGAWNESTSASVAGTGGGVSLLIPTPSWQTGTGVPSPAVGRYTPDISFSSAGHDGYFACMAAAQANSCVTVSGSFGFIAFEGTSAAAPSMAGVAALLDQKMGVAQGNLTPLLYLLAASVAGTFHDVTPTSSGVGSSCNVNTASLCNNSMTLLSGSGAQPGFPLTAGYDEATGLGSLDVTVFLNGPQAVSSLASIGASPSAVKSDSTTSVTVTLNTTAPTGGTLVTLSSSNSIALPLPANVTVAAGQSSFSFPTQAGTVSASTAVTLSATFSGVTKQTTVTVNPVGVNPSFTVSGTAVTVAAGTASGNTSTITIMPANGFTGSVALTAVITSPQGTNDPPTFAFGSTSPVSITDGNSKSATMTISTTASSTPPCTASNELPSDMPSQRRTLYSGGGAVLACVLLFGIAPGRRKLRRFLGALLLLVTLAMGISACNSGNKTTSCSTTIVPGTTSGTYTITVTGTSGSTVTTGTVTLTVQ